MASRPAPPSTTPSLPPLDAGELSAWIPAAQAAIRGVAEADVPCGSCNACCRASQFINVEPDDLDARAHIPARLLVAAPGLPPGHHVLGYDAQGRCPMLVDDRCSIYDHRPRTCRRYDCRVFAAAQIVPSAPRRRRAAGPPAPTVADQVLRWQFRQNQPGDAARLAAIAAAADFLRAHATLLPPGAAQPTQLAALALLLHPAFLRGGPAGEPELFHPDAPEVLTRLQACLSREAEVPATPV